jgi:hypothetical protein
MQQQVKQSQQDCNGQACGNDGVNAISRRLVPEPEMEMQNTIGNHGLVRRYGLPIQAKLKVSEPNDEFEQEADRIADQVMGMPAHPSANCTPLCIQRFSGQSNGQMDAAPTSVDQVLASPGSPLEPALQQDMEQRFGYDFSRVRVHYGPAAEQSVRDVWANAYTVGHNIVFGANKFAPSTSVGSLLLAHELAHVVQQTHGAPPIVSRTPDKDDDIQDRENIQEQREREQTEQLSHHLFKLDATAEPELDYWEHTARKVFGAVSYDAYCGTLKSTTFCGSIITGVHQDLIDKLQMAENDIHTRQGSNYSPPRPDSALRKRKGMHGWGMAVDFDVLKNPYVLNESGEKELDKELIKSYNRIASFMLGKSASDLGKLKGGRAAFGGSIAAVYDALREESEAMKRYFAMLNDEDAIRLFLEDEWPLMHPGHQPSDIATIKADIREDYEVLGGTTVSGGKRPTGAKGDRPFAPTSSNFKGDPSTGFLNLDKDFVEALTGAGLAWGAVDIAGEPGDIQHFDLRFYGIGKHVYELMLK